MVGRVSEKTRPFSASPTHMSMQVRVEQHQSTGECMDPI